MPPANAKPQQAAIMQPNRKAWGTTVGGMVMLIVLFAFGRYAPTNFVQHFTVFVLACFVGWQVVWSVNPALHTPLMSVTNAISGIIILGGMLQVSGAPTSAATILGAAAILLATINVAGGFHGPARRRDDVGLHHAAHAGHADRRQQAANSGGN